MSKHTTGPWLADDGGWIEGVCVYAGCGSHEAQWANPADYLLALAAPELLAALYEIANGYEESGHSLRQVALAAIAKATGEQQ